MIIIMERNVSEENIEAVKERLSREGFKIHLSSGVARTIIGVIGEDTKTKLREMAIEVMPGVEKVVPILQPYKLAGREFHPEDSVINVGNRKIGGEELEVIAGPCAVESEESLLQAAEAVKKAGATMLRGGAFKPRTSPYSFQGLQEKGLKILAKARELTGLPVVTEVMDQNTVHLVAEYADLLQVGARNMQNFYLLKELGAINKPVLLKRGLSSTIEEWILAAEYIMAGGNYNVIFCERGIRTFETYTRNTLDLSTVPIIKHLSHLPIIVDPSHGTGQRQLVAPMSKAAVAAGADGLMVEVHPNPSEAVSDGSQSLTPDDFAGVMEQIKKIAHIEGRKLA